jgi:hypothetical protein
MDPSPTPSSSNTDEQVDLSQESKREDQDGKEQATSVRVATSSRSGATSRTRFDTTSTFIEPVAQANITPTKRSHSTALPVLPPAKHTTRQSYGQAFFNIIKRLLPCVISVFLGAIFVVCKRIAFLSGTAEYAFLIVVIYTLFFHPAQHTVGKHIQVTGKHILN